MYFSNHFTGRCMAGNINTLASNFNLINDLEIIRQNLIKRLSQCT